MIELIAQTINFWVFVLTSILSLLILVGVIYGPYRIIRYVLSRIVTMAGRWKKNRLGRRTKEFMINAWADELASNAMKNVTHTTDTQPRAQRKENIIRGEC